MKLLLLISILLSSNAFAGFDQNHTKFSEVLSEFSKQIENQTLVNYKGLKAKKGKLTEYLKQVEDLTKKEFKSFSSDQKLAFWINIYNAYTLDLIVTHYPIKSIKDIGSFFSGPWSQKIVKVFGKKMTLDQVEHKTIRKQFKEPRIHFAVNCASIGCPSLLPEAFTADKIEEQLDKSTKNFLNNKTKNYEKNGTLYLSKIFDWYGDDFIEKYGSYKNFVKKYYSLSGEYKVEFLEYDWKLNQL
jgi:hypothetical protein